MEPTTAHLISITGEDTAAIIRELTADQANYLRTLADELNEARMDGAAPWMEVTAL